MSKLTIHINPEDIQNPQIDAGISQSIEKDSQANITLSGLIVDSGSAPIISTLWEVISKPAVSTPVINSSSSLTTTVSDVVENVGTYIFRLTSTNGDSGIGTDEVLIEVTAVPIPPIEVEGGIDQLLPLVPNPQIQLTGTIIEHGTTAISTILWEIIQQPGVSNLSFDNDTILTPLTSTAVVAGLYIFKVTITNASLESTNDLVEVILGTIPVVNAGVDLETILPDNEVFLIGSAIDSDGSIVSTSWTKILGPTGGSVISPNTLSTIIELLVEGIYTFKLTAVDNDGFIGEDTVLVEVLPAIIPSTLIFVCSQPVSGSGTISLKGGIPNEVLDLEFTIVSCVPGSVIEFGSEMIVPLLDCLHTSRIGTITLNGVGKQLTTYQITGDLDIDVKITGRSSGLQIPNINTIYIPSRLITAP